MVLNGSQAALGVTPRSLGRNVPPQQHPPNLPAWLQRAQLPAALEHHATASLSATMYGSPWRWQAGAVQCVASVQYPCAEPGAPQPTVASQPGHRKKKRGRDAARIEKVDAEIRPGPLYNGAACLGWTGPGHRWALVLPARWGNLWGMTTARPEMLSRSQQETAVGEAACGRPRIPGRCSGDLCLGAGLDSRRRSRDLSESPRRGYKTVLARDPAARYEVPPPRSVVTHPFLPRCPLSRYRYLGKDRHERQPLCDRHL